MRAMALALSTTRSPPQIMAAAPSTINTTHLTVEMASVQGSVTARFFRVAATVHAI